MKKCAALLLVLLALVCCAAADKPTEYTCGDFEYILLEDGTAEITGYTGGAAELVVPDALDGYRVTGIGDYAFSSCRSLTSITLPEGVTSIGKWAFQLCGSLTSITLPDSLARIGDYAFSNCTSLTSITIPDNVMQMGVNPFAVCRKLTAINVSPGHPVFVTIDGVLFDKTEKS